MEIGEKIKAARLAKNMTQEELGDLIGVQKSAIAKYENGRVVNIKRSVLRDIARVLGINPADLIFGDSDKSHLSVSDIILSDPQTVGMMEEYYTLDVAHQSIVRDFIHNLSIATNIVAEV